jgi:cytochrome b
MAKKDVDDIGKLLSMLEKTKFVKQFIEGWREQSKRNMQTTIIIVVAILATILLLNLLGKLSTESNGWIIAALIGYLFGRIIQK